MKKNYSFVRVISIIVFLVIWELGSVYVKRTQVINPNFLPGPTDVLATGIEYAKDGTLLVNLEASFVRVLKGFGIGSFIAILVGYFMAKYPLVENIIDPIFSMLGSIPAYAFMPLFIIWFGVGEGSKLTLIAFSTCLPVLSYTIQGVKSVDPLLIRSAKSLGANELQVFSRVIFKTELPFVLEGMKISLALSFSALIVAEMMGADKGLGYVIVNARNWFKVSDMFLAMVLIGAMYIVMQSILTFLENWLCKWKKTGVSAAIE